MCRNFHRSDFIFIFIIETSWHHLCKISEIVNWNHTIITILKKCMFLGNLEQYGYEFNSYWLWFKIIQTNWNSNVLRNFLICVTSFLKLTNMFFFPSIHSKKMKPFWVFLLDHSSLEFWSLKCFLTQVTSSETKLLCQRNKQI